MITASTEEELKLDVSNMLDIKEGNMGSKKGSLTIEASIAMTAFIFIVVTILSFATVYRAQSIVSHATLQTSQALAIESYYRETISKAGSADLASKLIKFAGYLGFDFAGYDDGYASLGNEGTNLYGIIRETFAYAIAEDVDEADRILEDVGIPGGLDGIDFLYSSVHGSDIIINVRYKVKLPVSFFGESIISFSKSAKTKSFSELKSEGALGSSGGGFRE